ncbi:hypothetical protein SAMN04487949_2765 [Halogranum gelatinilyticum]|uniref:PH domain-containing protein n=1 Tax=Halogranum gelatinilyticum TaxID=660521 RepID=A0A1G9WHS3_9EURY|nr:hypothetical protein [Halogranum gelatinilyticum]SDM84040.1 hypothetical protein SAMN04487949_2765 [Halogranum gelatinilyticum]
MANPTFREVQRFRQPWLWAFLILVLLPTAIVGGPFGALVGGAVALFVWSLRLTTEVREDALYVRFFPFHVSEKRIPWSDVAAAEAVRYRPLRDYGGWGIRFAKGRLAYNVRGSEGVRLTRPGERELLVGSQEPYELARAIRDAMRNTGH